MRFFYGWLVLGGLFTVYAVSNGISNFTLPLFYPSLMNEFGWDQEEVTRPAAIKFAFASIYSLIIGYLMDRYSPRPIMITGALLMVLGLVLFTIMDQLWHFTGIYLLFAFGLSLCGLLPCMVLTSRWFTVYRGRAVGILLMASSLGGAILPLIIRGSLEEGNWREGAYILAALALIFMVLPFIWPVKSRPEDIGETPDGLSASNSNVSVKKEIGIFSGVSLRAVAKMPAFYLLLVATGTLWFCISAVVQHQSIYLGKDQGIQGGQLAEIFSVFFACSVIGKFVFGWLSDRVVKGYVMLLAICNLILGLLILRFVEGASLWVIYLYAVVYGIGFSGAFTMVQLMIAELFAGPTYGRILGIYLFVDTLASAVGINLLGTIRVSSGSYIPAIDLMIALCVFGFICVVLLNRITLFKDKRETASA